MNRDFFIRKSSFPKGNSFADSSTFQRTSFPGGGHSRSGKSLELILSAVFDAAGVKYSEQMVTPEGDKPDFIFPSKECYLDLSFPPELLSHLASKTTLKERWTEVLDEASRISQKHLFTLDSEIPEKKAKRIGDKGLQLVLPAGKRVLLCEKAQEVSISLSEFIETVLRLQERWNK